MRHYFFFNDTATTEIYTLSLHDALPIWGIVEVDASAMFLHDLLDDCEAESGALGPRRHIWLGKPAPLDRKSTRLNSSHANISYAVFCLEKKRDGTRAFPETYSAEAHRRR